MALAPEARLHIAKYEELVAEKKSLLPAQAVNNEKMLSVASKQEKSNEKKRATVTVSLQSYVAKEKFLLEKLSKENLKDNYNRWVEENGKLSTLLRKQQEHQHLEKICYESEQAYKDADHKFQVEYKDRVDKLHQLQEQMKMLQDAGCLDVENASCKFLQSAKMASATYETLLAERSTGKNQKYSRSLS